MKELWKVRKTRHATWRSSELISRKSSWTDVIRRVAENLITWNGVNLWCPCSISSGCLAHIRSWMKLIPRTENVIYVLWSHRVMSSLPANIPQWETYRGWTWLWRYSLRLNLINSISPQVRASMIRFDERIGCLALLINLFPFKWSSNSWADSDMSVAKCEMTTNRDQLYVSLYQLYASLWAKQLTRPTIYAAMLLQFRPCHNCSSCELLIPIVWV